MTLSKVDHEKDMESVVSGQSVRGSHAVKLRGGNAPRGLSRSPRWNSDAAFKLGGWKLLAVIAVVIVAVVVVVAFMLMGSLKPPVDVYARGTPAADALPEDLIPATAAGNAMVSSNADGESGYVDAMADYDGGIHIEITRFDSASDAQAYVGNGDDAYSALSGTHASASGGEKQWFTHNGGGEDSAFVWRKGVWVFEIYAPNADMVKQVAGEFAY